MTEINSNLHQVWQKISALAERYERSPEEITLVAISKMQPVNAIEKALAAGQLKFGENYVQEGVNKIQTLKTTAEIEWHFTGHLQSNKSYHVAQYFSWCHTLDRTSLAQRLNDQRPTTLPPLNVLIQINISGEKTKAGIEAHALPPIAEYIAHLPNLVLRGLMAIPAPAQGFSAQLAAYRGMQVLFDRLKATYATVDTLSLGMSSDIEAAIAAGSTMVRIGTAIFGPRLKMSRGSAC